MIWIYWAAAKLTGTEACARFCGAVTVPGFAVVPPRWAAAVPPAHDLGGVGGRLRGCEEPKRSRSAEHLLVEGALEPDADSRRGWLGAQAAGPGRRCHLMAAAAGAAGAPERRGLRVDAKARAVEGSSFLGLPLSSRTISCGPEERPSGRLTSPNLSRMRVSTIIDPLDPTTPAIADTKDSWESPSW